MMYCRERECAEKRAETRGEEGRERRMAEFGTFTTEEKDTALERRIEKKRRDRERESAGSATWHSVAASPRSAADGIVEEN